MSNCMYCNSDVHYLCLFPKEDGHCCCENIVPSSDLNLELDQLSDVELKPVKAGKYRLHRATGKPVGRPPTADEDIVYQESSGRRRALLAMQKEGWIAGQPCGWAYLKYAGGGVEPIIGCKGNPSKPIHHGPDKSTLNNDLSNLHAICRVCHARWHAANDKYYDSERPPNGQPYLPTRKYKLHDYVTPATELEIETNDWRWELRRRQSRIAIKDRKPYSGVNLLDDDE